MIGGTDIYLGSGLLMRQYETVMVNL